MPLSRSVLVPMLACLLAAPLRAQEANWSQWRGPAFNGSTRAVNLPDSIDPAKPLWVTPMPGHSNGTAIVHGDRVFTTAVTPGDMKLIALCLSKKDGKILWQKEVAEGFSKNRLNDYATPSPVTDGKSVFFLFGNGWLLACDMEGKELWKRNLQADHGTWNVLWIYGSSPLLYNGKLYVPVIHRSTPTGNWKDPRPGEQLAPSYLLAINPATGKDLWKQVRPSDAKAESQESYCTPIPWERAGGTQILLTGGDCVSAHNPETGKEIWRAGGWNPEKIGHWRLVPSAVAVDDLVIVCPPKKGLIRAFKGTGTGDVTKSHLAWMGEGLTSDVAVPLIYKGSAFVLDGDFSKSLSCIDPATGKVKWSGRLESKTVLRSSPTGADNKIYLTNESGDVYICSADAFKILCVAKLGPTGATRCSVAAVDGMIVLRAGDKVWAFGK